MKNRTNTQTMAYLLSSDAEHFTRELMKRRDAKAAQPHDKTPRVRQQARLLKRQGD